MCICFLAFVFSSGIADTIYNLFTYTHKIRLTLEGCKRRRNHGITEEAEEQL